MAQGDVTRRGYGGDVTRRGYGGCLENREECTGLVGLGLGLGLGWRGVEVGAAISTLDKKACEDSVCLGLGLGLSIGLG